MPGVRRLVIIFAAVGLLVAGCGGGSNSSKATTTTGPSGPPLTKAAYQAKLKQIATEISNEIGKTSSSGKKIPKDEIAQRCALMFVNEAALCYGEGILRSARDGDIGAVFGLGFPPFRGGPFHYMDAVGASEIVRRLEKHEKTHGLRFHPAPLLLETAKRGTKFHTT